MHNKNHHMLGVSLISAIAGAAVTYYLYATKPGAKKRQEFRDLARDTVHNMKEKASDMEGEIEEGVKEKLCEFCNK